MRFDEIRTSDV